MKYIFHVSPNLQDKKASTPQIMRDLTIGLAVIFGCSFLYYCTAWGFNYGLQTLILLACSLVTTFVCEAVFAKIEKEDIKKFILHSYGWVTSLILVMMCPVSITPYAVIIATIFAIVIGRLVFGGFGQNIYNPAGVGRAVIFACFTGAVTSLTTSATPTGVMASSFRWMPGTAEALDSFLTTTGGWMGLFMGTYPGAIGETFSIAILLVGIVLALRDVIDWRMPVVYLGTIFITTMFIAIFSGIGSYGFLPGWIWYPLVHLLTGGVMFGAFFMLTDPVTIPTVPAGRVFFAACAAVITVLIRVKGNLPEGCLFSILIMNTFTPMIEQSLDGPQFGQIKKAWIMLACALVMGLGVAFYASSTIKPVKGAKNLDEEATALVVPAPAEMMEETL